MAQRQAAVDRGESHEPQPWFEGAFAPVSRTAMSITDEIVFEGDTIQFGFGHAYGTASESMIPPGDPGGAGFRKVLFASADAYVEVRQVTSELVNPRAENGGLCRPDAARWIVLTAERDADGITGDVAMAAYGGESKPAPDAADVNLCGTFSYMRKVER